jgi:AcrR family transcriptional regulator
MPRLPPNKHKRPADPPADGRVLRGARNHELIVQAVYDLVRSGNVDPSIEEVASQAGVGTRTIFRQFNDLETLSRSLGERVVAEITVLIELTPPSGRLIEDLRGLIARRARVYEHVTPFRRAGRLVRHRVLFIQEQDALMARMLRAAVESVLAPHGLDKQRDLVEALDVLLSFEAWDRLRDQQKLGVKRAEQVLLGAATALVQGGRGPR